MIKITDGWGGGERNHAERIWGAASQSYSFDPKIPIHNNILMHRETSGKTSSLITGIIMGSESGAEAKSV